MEVDKTEQQNNLQEMLEQEANRGSDNPIQEEQKGGNDSNEDDDDEMITKTRRRRLIKKVQPEPAESDPDQAETQPEQSSKATAGRRLRRVAARKTVVQSSDEEDNQEKAIDIDGDDEEFDAINQGKKGNLKRKKSAKKGSKEHKKLRGLKQSEKSQRKLTKSKDEDNFEENDDGEFDADQEELVRTPPSSHHPSEDEADADDDQIVVNKKTAKAGAKAKKQPAAKTARTKRGANKIEEADAALNIVKSRNRLIGDIQNNELYADDDEQPMEKVEYQEDFNNGEQLDLGLGDKTNAPKKQFNFFNKQSKLDTTDLNAKIKQLGFSRDITVNELAAKGVNLSLRDQIIEKLKQDEATREQAKLAEAEAQSKLAAEAEDCKKMEIDEVAKPTTMIITTSDAKPLQQTNLKNMVDRFCQDAQALKKGAASPTNVADLAVPRTTAEDESEDDCGLEFVDPEAIKKAEQAEAAANKVDNQKPKMVQINGKMVPASTVSLNQNSMGQAGGQPSQAGRNALFSQLRGQIMKKTSRNIDLAQIQSTFKTQDLQSKKKEDVTVEDALAHELEKGTGNGNGADEFPDDDDDESYREEGAAGKANVEMESAPVEQNWDDEENIKSITEGDLADCVQSSLDNDASLPIKRSGKATPGSVASFKSQKSKSVKSAADAKSVNNDNDDSADEMAEIAEALKSNNESSLGAASLLMRNEQELEQAQALRKKKQKARAAAKFMDLEADLGSDNEENDDRVKRINADDFEEDEAGLDDSLDGFVDHEAPAGDDQEIEAGNDAARDLFMAKQAEDERALIKQTMGAVFYGQNKKRKRGEIEFDDLDEQQKIYFKRREERLQNDMMDEDDLADQKAFEEKENERKLKEAAEEDEMSDEEVQKQLQDYRLLQQRRQMKAIGEDVYNRYTNVAAKKRAADEQLDNLIVDMTAGNKTVQPSQASNSLISSKSKQQLSTTDQKQQYQQTTMIDTKTGGGLNRKNSVPQKFNLGGAQMLDRKKVVSDQGLGNNNGLKSNAQSTAATSKTEKQQAAAPSGMMNLSGMFRAKRMVTGSAMMGGSSMMSLVKTGENQGAGVAAKTKRPMLFGYGKK